MKNTTINIQCLKWAGTHWHWHFCIWVFSIPSLFLALLTCWWYSEDPNPISCFIRKSTFSTNLRSIHFFSGIFWLVFTVHGQIIWGLLPSSAKQERAADRGWSACRPILWSINQSFIQVLLNHSLNHSLKQVIQNNDSFRKETSLREWIIDSSNVFKTLIHSGKKWVLMSESLNHSLKRFVQNKNHSERKQRRTDNIMSKM